MRPAVSTEPMDTTPPSPAGDLDAGEVAIVQTALLAWFEANRRDLPWRHTRDPYRVLVSEVMLQQIQVSRAIPFYLAFLDRFPTIETLAAAPLAEAIRVWGDLGRYRRVVNFHRTARHIVDELGGVFPHDPETLRRLPGIGPYTAGAIACFAFEDDTAFVDTNMRRVLHRLFVGVDLPEPAVTDGEILRLAKAAVPPGQGWLWNPGLMEFGALHCTARRPRCETCMLQASCRAYPAILDALAAQRREDRSRSRPAYRYEDTGRRGCGPNGADGDERRPAEGLGPHRVYRGRVLAVLRSLPEHQGGVDLRALGSRLHEDFGEADAPWLAGVVASLQQDGLAVAEERPAYDAGDGAEVVVRLP